MPDLFQYDSQWRRLVNKTVASGYDSLSPEEKVWFNIQVLIQAVDNGGLISYYYNSGADMLGDCFKALEDLGDETMSHLILQVNDLFPDGVPTNIEARNQVIDSWPDDGSVDKFLDPIEKKSSVEARRLEQLLVRYIEAHGLAT